MAREGQEKVEIRPGAFVWFSKADADAFRARQADNQASLITSTTTETATTTTAETAVLPKASKPRARQTP